MYSLPQRLAAEFLGTFTLVFITSGAICADQYLRASNQPGIGLLGIAVAEGLAYSIMVTALLHVSGAHFNPAVTIGLWVTRRSTTMQSVFYVAAQLLGSVTAAYLLVAVIPETIWRPASLGAPDLTADFTRMHGMALEAVVTFFLVLAMYAAIVDAKGMFQRTGGFAAGLAGFAAGLAATMGALVAGPFTGAGMNPARVFGPALAARHWQNHGVYWVGPLFGGIVAGFIYDRCFLRDQPPD
jgi:MIP family channel proteins